MNSAERVTDKEITILFGGDVMLGRGVDQILPCSNGQELRENWRGITSTQVFVDAARQRNGPFAEKGPVSYEYPWGDCLAEFARDRADLRIINLESPFTDQDTFAEKSGPHFRSHPGNIEVLKRANIDASSFANNHSYDFGLEGIEDTLAVMKEENIGVAGAGKNREEAFAPLVFDLGEKGRMGFFSIAAPSCGAQPESAAEEDRPGIALEILDREGIENISDLICRYRHELNLNVIVLSVHWGPNWTRGVHPVFRKFAHSVIDLAAVDFIHGHSSHHLMGMEVYQGKGILYGCGDLMNDYEGSPQISAGKSSMAYSSNLDLLPDFGALIWVSIDPGKGRLKQLSILPVRRRWFQINKASHDEILRIKELLDRQCHPLGTEITDAKDGLELCWG